MPTIKRKLLWVLTPILVCAVFLLAWVTQPPGKDLLTRATRVSGVRADQDIHPYGWISDHELLLFHFPPDGSWSLTRYDLVTGRESPLTALTALYRRSGGCENSPPPRISPDGEHFLWVNWKSQVFGADLGGAPFLYQSQKYGMVSPCWLDNTHWAFLEDDKDDTHLFAVETHDIRAPYPVQRLRLSPHITLRSNKNFEFPRLTLTPDHRLFVLLATFSQSTPVCVNEYAVASRLTTERTHFLPLPQKPSRPFLISSTQSPTDGRVAFALLFQPTPSLWQPLLHLLRMRDTPDAVGGLYVGDPATGKVHEVGHIVVDGFAGYGPIGDVRWLPSGKRLSFEHQGVLYTVPAG